MDLFGKKPEEKENSQESEEVKGKYNEQCSICGKSPTDKHWANQYFHKKCFRKLRKGAKGML